MLEERVEHQYPDIAYIDHGLMSRRLRVCLVIQQLEPVTDPHQTRALAALGQDFRVQSALTYGERLSASSARDYDVLQQMASKRRQESEEEHFYPCYQPQSETFLSPERKYRFWQEQGRLCEAYKRDGMESYLNSQNTALSISHARPAIVVNADARKDCFLSPKRKRAAVACGE